MQTANAATPRLRDFDHVVVNSSAGKDSQAMLDAVVEEAKKEGVLERVVVVHADLGRVEWAGTRELAERQARHYGVRFEVVLRSQNDLLDHVLARGRWPSPSARYCTSDHKRGPVATLFTRLTAETRQRNPGQVVRLLNCLGLRADESPARAKLVPFQLDERASNGKRTVYRWLPLHSWTAEAVWARIRASGVESHPAYALGMPRLSCCFCIFAPKAALLLAARHNQQLLEEYVRVEEATGHKFRQDVSLADVRRELQEGVEAGPVESWEM
ncbi:MAG TPA: phosphoadenosine phosphosulfate reductase family protein [Gemmataceae bacterium]|nr:phosphoadenosine phosphosulfate reductase family protein [Gemmataceae bacterium]